MSLPHSPGALVELGEGASWPRLTVLSGTQTPSLSLLMRVVSLRLWRWDGGNTLLLCFWRWGKVETEEGTYFPRQRFRLWAAGVKGGGSQEVWWGSTTARGDEIRLHTHTRAYTHISLCPPVRTHCPQAVTPAIGRRHWDQYTGTVVAEQATGISIPLDLFAKGIALHRIITAYCTENCACNTTYATD